MSLLEVAGRDLLPDYTDITEHGPPRMARG